jgi:hypothetical protein
VNNNGGFSLKKRDYLIKNPLHSLGTTVALAFIAEELVFQSVSLIHFPSSSALLIYPMLQLQPPPHRSRTPDSF